MHRSDRLVRGFETGVAAQSTSATPYQKDLGACPSNPSSWGKGAAGRCEAAGSEKTGGVFAGIRWGFFRAENDADACRSFVAAEWHYSDRLL